LKSGILQEKLYGTIHMGSFPREFKATMTPIKIVAIVLIVAGVAALAYGGFSYTKETHKAEIGPLKFSVAEKETVNVPQWAGIGAIVAGVVLLAVGGKK
jgi:multidrug transporter EmrE-like cation transporter